MPALSRAQPHGSPNVSQRTLARHIAGYPDGVDLPLDAAVSHPDALRRNAILSALPAREFDRLAEGMQVVDAWVRQTVYEPHRPIAHVYFPLESVFSLVALADDRVVVEVATIGREGMVGLPVFLGATTSPHSAFCQIEGAAARLSVEDLRRALTRDGALHHALNRFTQATMVQIAQNVVCNGAHAVEQRAARWLLTTRDRVARDEFPLTHDFMAQMLGTRRPTVSEVARRLQGRGLIRYTRGRVSILDETGLRDTACDCYNIVKAEFDAMIDGR
jgi:CRP-like cAMP-binding protein